MLIISVGYLITGLIYKPIVSNDALNGFISLHNYLAGEHWNKLLTFEPTTARITANELTWWTPAQYALPYCFSELLHVNIGTAVSIILFISLIGGGYFYYRVFKLSALSGNLVLVSILILFLQRFININFLQYSSSDLILFCYSPFYIFFYFKFKDLNIKSLSFAFPLLLLLNLFGLFLKNSFLLFETAFSVFLLTEIITASRGEGRMLRCFVLLFPFALSLVIYYWCFLRLGSNPTNGAGILISVSTLLNGIFNGITGTLFSSLSITAVYGNLYGKISLINPYDNLLIGCCILVIAVIIYKCRNKIVNQYKTDEVFRVVVVLSVMYILFWILFAIKQSYISNEDRLFLPVTIFVLPYLIAWFSKAPGTTKYIGIGIVCFSLLYGTATFIFRIRVYNRSMSVASENQTLQGFKVFMYNRDALNDIHRISEILSGRYNHNYLVITDINDAFLLKTCNRIMQCNVNSVPDVIKLRGLPNNKKYLMLINKKAKGRSFINWKKIYTSAEYDLYQTI